MTTLVIVESPGKIKTIQKYLDSLWPQKYEVQASIGHVCDLSVKSLGFDPKTFEGHYEVSEDKQKVVRNLKAIAKRSNDVILAMDKDREGEAIAFHLMRELRLTNPDRIVFNEITKPAIEKAMKAPVKIDLPKVYAQETRRILDRMIGWRVSPVARNYVVPDGSMGRVQTVVVLILVLNDRAIKQFVSEKHYGVSMMMLNNEKVPVAPWSADWDHKSWREPDQKIWLDRPSAEKVQTIKTLVVDNINIGESTNSPPPPLITSTLQRAAEINLNLSPKETMAYAQKLYEAGVITYMRTDNPNLSAEAYIAIKDYCLLNDLPIEPTQRKFSTKKNAQEAHEAIRPTSFSLLKVADGVMQDVYELIWNRAVACQLKATKYDTKEVLLSQSVQVTINGVPSTKKAIFKAKGRRQTYEGWRILNKKEFSEVEVEDREEESDLSNLIPEKLKVGDTVEVKDTQLHEKNTEAPRRYSVVGLIAELERCGIGRPSTYVSLIDTLLKRKFITIEKKKVFVAEAGFKIIDTMANDFSFIDVKYTAGMEDKLDDIEAGSLQFKSILQAFWDEVNQEVSGFEKRIVATLPQYHCEACNSLVLKKSGKKGAFWRCSNEPCSAVYVDKNGTLGSRQVTASTNFDCVECGRKLNYRKGSYEGRDYEYFQCSGVSEKEKPCAAKYKTLPNLKDVAPDFDLYKEENKHKCHECGRTVLKKCSEKTGVKKYFWVCTGKRKESPLCNVSYQDKNGSPDIEGYKAQYLLDHTHKCIAGECTNFIKRRKYREKEGCFWVCDCKSFYGDLNGLPDYEAFKITYEQNHTHKCIHEGCSTGYLARIQKKNKADGFFWKCNSCPSFYTDKDKLPDFEKFKIDHTHKCFNCQSYIYNMVSLTNVSKWRCAEATCCIPYENLDGKPNYEIAKATYIHQCSKCKFGKLKSIISPKSNRKQWVCQNNVCNTYYEDVEGLPDLKTKKKAKK